MRKLLFWFLSLPVATFLAFGQVKTFENFDTLKPDSVFTTSKDGVCRIDASAETSDKKEGTAAMRLRAVLPSANTWGAYTQIGHKNHDPLFNWGTSDTLSLWIKVTMAPTHPEAMSFRLQVTEYNGGDQGEVWVFQNNSILDGANGWVNLKIPLVERMPADGSLSPDSTGFCIAPATWGWPPFINKKFDADKIATWYLTQLTIVDVADSVEVLYDNFQQTGSKAAPITIFNGVAFTGIVTQSDAWGSGGFLVEKGAGPEPKTNAVKWTQGNGWSGWYADMTPSSLVGSWLTDSLKMKIKTDTGVGQLRVQLMAVGGGKVGKVFQPTADNAWHDYAFALKDLVYQDATTSIDSGKINKFELMAENSGVANKVVYTTNIWTGNPEFDVIPPDAPTGVLAIGGSFKNVITWTNDTKESGETYDLYISEKTFTTIDEPGVEDHQKYKISEVDAATEHLLRSPVTDQNITLYYGVTSTDQAGNTSPVTVSSSITTKAKGVPTIAKAPPANIAIDGDLAEWETAGITPIVISKVAATGQGHVAGAGIVDGDLDLKVKSYLAVDANNLYVAFDVDDDIYGGDSALYKSASYAVDGCDLFLGLYDWRGPRHRGYLGAATPDYHFRFTKFGAILDNPNNGKHIDASPSIYKWTEKGLTPGYIIEAKFPFQLLADTLGLSATAFSPVEGMRIPIDYSINDNDGKAFNPSEPWNARDGILCYSPFNDDNSHQDMWRWSYTWIGAKWSTGVQKNDGVIASSFELSQNYPNPFNPTTNIRFSIPKAGLVSLKIYDILGREVMDVVNTYQDAGSYTVSLDASKLATGIYVYRLESGSFSSTKKMMLIK